MRRIHGDWCISLTKGRWSISLWETLSCQWLSARLQYLQCICNGDTTVLHWAIYVIRSREVLEWQHWMFGCKLGKNSVMDRWHTTKIIKWHLKFCSWRIISATHKCFISFFNFDRIGINFQKKIYTPVVSLKLQMIILNNTQMNENVKC